MRSLVLLFFKKTIFSKPSFESAWLRVWRKRKGNPLKHECGFFFGDFYTTGMFSYELSEVLGGYLREDRVEKRLSLPFFEGDEPGFHAENLAISTVSLT